MATTVGSSTPLPTTPAATGTAATKKTSGVDDIANRDTFLQLLIAQIKNQNPLNPTDGVQFLTQLAQFSSLEQGMQMRDSLSSIQTVLDGRLPAASGTTTTSANQGKS